MNEWREVLARRTRTSKTKRLYEDDQPTNKYSWDGMVGTSLHYLDAQGAWQDVDDTVEKPDVDGFTIKFPKLSYFGRIDDEGRRRFYPDRNDLSYWIEFKKPYPNMGTPTRHNRWFYWDFAHAVIGIRFDVDSLKFGFRLKDEQAPTSITIPFETWGITRHGRFLLHDGEIVAALRRPIATGSNLDEDGTPVQKGCSVTWGSGQVTISLDPTGLEYPIDIDPTIDVQVGASSDDAYEVEGQFASITSLENVLLANNYWVGLRFTGVNIPSGATISTDAEKCYLDLYLPNDDDDLFTGKDIYCENGSNPGTFTTSSTTISSRTTTAAKVSLTAGAQGIGWAKTPQLAELVQEVVDDNSGTGDALVFIFESTTGDDLDIQAWDFDDHSLAPKLYIEYSLGDGANPWYYYAQQQ